MLKLSSLKIDPEFSAQILPLSFEELQQLEMNMIRDRKLTDPIIVWNKTILDRHNRYNILRKHSFIEYEIKEMEFSSRQEALIWICNHQLGRRNLTPERRKYLIGTRYEAEKQVFQNRGNQYTFAKKNATNQNDPCQNKSGSHVTRQRIANETGTSEGYVQRAEKYMNGVEAADEAAPGAREEILNGKIKAADREICAIAKAPKEQRSEIVAELRKPKSEQDKQLASSTKSPSVKVESFDDDGSRFLIGISKKVQGHKRALTESDQKALKKSVEASADHSIHIAAIEGAYDAFKTGKDCILREFEDKREGSSSALVLKKTKTASSCRTIFMTEALKEELKHWFKCLEMDEADMDGRYRNSGMLLRLPNGLAVEPILIRKKFIKWQDAHPEFPHIVFHGLRHSSATYQLMISGGDVKAVQGTTGHASANLLVNTYAHIQQDSRKKLGKRFEEGFYKPGATLVQAAPVEAEPTISVSALLELLKDADPAVKAQLRLALLT